MSEQTYLEHRASEIEADCAAHRAAINAAANGRTEDSDEFLPTHTILFETGRAFFMFCPDENGNGPLYDSSEWEYTTTADYEIVNDQLLFQGQPSANDLEIWV